MSKKDILDRINEIIEEEHGRPLQLSDDRPIVEASELDSLGITLLLITLDSEFNIFKGAEGDDAFAAVNAAEITTRELVQLCRSSTTNT